MEETEQNIATKVILPASFRDKIEAQRSKIEGGKVTQKDHLFNLLKFGYEFHEKGQLKEEEKEQKNAKDPEDEDLLEKQKYDLERYKLHFQERIEEKNKKHEEILQKIEEYKERIHFLEKKQVSVRSEEISKKIKEFEDTAKNYIEKDPVFSKILSASINATQDEMLKFLTENERIKYIENKISKNEENIEKMIEKIGKKYEDLNVKNIEEMDSLYVRKWDKYRKELSRYVIVFLVIQFLILMWAVYV